MHDVLTSHPGPARSTRPLRVALIGLGAIGRGVMALLRDDPLLRFDRVLVHEGSRARAEAALAAGGLAGVPVAARLDLEGARPDVVVECAGHAAIEEHVLPALAGGVPCVVASVGALAAPFVGDRLRAAGLSGTGGGLSMTVVPRKDPLDIAALLEAALGFAEGETLTTFHPVTGLVQMLSEATDPINYAGHWFAERPDWEANPLPIVVTEGLHDEATPSVTTEALAAAARLPIVGDAATEPVALELRGLDSFDFPASDNVRDWNGDARTAGLGQFPDDGHFAVYDNRKALRLYRDFIVSALDGAPTLDP